ncbi:MAG TPA: hypothetical protein VNI61_04040 [Gemmatimonadales bacterium]|nr:hypothetical protein [Gemmatimonadales bacterium]
MADSNLLVYGLRLGSRLHVVDLDGRRLRSFASADATLSPMAQDLLAQGRIWCNPQRDEVLVSSKFLQLVEAFQISTGQRVWVDTLRPFRTIALSDRGTRVTISSGRAGFSLVSSLFSIGDYRLFQTTYESRLDNPAVDTIVTYVYSRRTGTWFPPQFDVPLLLPLRGAKVLSVEESDRLEIKLHRLAIGGDGTDARPTNRRK